MVIVAVSDFETAIVIDRVIVVIAIIEAYDTMTTTIAGREIVIEWIIECIHAAKDKVTRTIG